MCILLLHSFVSLEASSRGEVGSFRLPNGLRVILAPVDNIEATCILTYHLTGVRDDPPEIKGASYLYQNLMLAGTEHFGVVDRILLMKRFGSISDRIVSYDYSLFYLVVPESEINNALWLESERISSLKLTDRIINIEKNTSYNKNSRNINYNIYANAAQWVKSNIFAKTPYETPLYGNLEEIKNFNTQAVRDVYNNYRNLSRIILVIAGKFNADELKKSISKYYSGLTSPPVSSKKTLSGPIPSIMEKNVFLNKPVENLKEPFFMCGFRTPSRSSYDYLYVEFLRYYLFDKRVSFLEKELNRKYDLNVTISHETTDYDDCNALIFGVAGKDRVTMDSARIATSRILEKLSDAKLGTISNSDFKTIKMLMEIDFLKDMTVLEKRSSFLAEHFRMVEDISKAEEEYLARIRRFTIYDISRTARKYLNKKNRAEITVFPGTGK